MDLGVPALAYLLDHVVARRSIMPGAGMFETCLAAAQSLLPDMHSAADMAASASGGGYGLTAAVIPQAVLLKPTTGRAAVLQCMVTSATGDIELGGQSGMHQHLTQNSCVLHVQRGAFQSAIMQDWIVQVYEHRESAHDRIHPGPRFKYELAV